MLNEHVFWFVQLCFSIAVLALTMIVVASAFKVIMNLWTGQNKNSNAGFQFANTNEWFNGTPEKVRQDYLEKSAIKSEPTNKWRNDDQKGCSGNSRGRSFPNTIRNLYSSSEQEHHGLKSLLEPIKTHNAFGESWREPLFNDSLEDNVVFPKYRRRDASWNTPINPLKNAGLFDTYRNSGESAKGDIQNGEEQRTIAVQTTKESAPSREWSFKPTIFTLKQDIRTWWNRFKLFVENNKIVDADLRNCVATFLDDNCLSRFEFRVPKGPVDMFELEKQMVKMFGQQPASQTDAVAEFYNRKQLPGEDFRDFYTNLWILARNAFVYTGDFDQSRYDYLVKERFITGLSEKAVFWRVDVSNPQTCSEAYDLVVQTYARLQILNRNQPNPIISEKMGDQENAYQGTHKHVKWSDQIDLHNTPDGEKICLFCSRKGHWGADCYLRKNQMNESSPKMREQFEQPISQGNGKLCLHCGKPGHLIADCYSRKNQMKLSMLGNKNRAEQSLSNQVINQIMFDKSIVGTLEMNSKPVSFLLDTGTVSTIVAKRIWDHCKTPDAALEPLDETLETCVGGPVKVIGKGKCSVKLISFESEVEIIIVDELVNDCLLGLDVAFKLADIKDYLESIRSALSQRKSGTILTCNLTKVPDFEGDNSGTVEESANIGTVNAATYKLIIEDEQQMDEAVDLNTSPPLRLSNILEDQDQLNLDETNPSIRVPIQLSHSVTRRSSRGPSMSQSDNLISKLTIPEEEGEVDREMAAGNLEELARFKQTKMSTDTSDSDTEANRVHEWARSTSSTSRSRARLRSSNNFNRPLSVSSENEHHNPALGQTPFSSKTLSVEHRLANMSQMSISSQLSKNNSFRHHRSTIGGTDTPAQIYSQPISSTTPTPRESVVFNRGDDKPFVKLLQQMNYKLKSMDQRIGQVEPRPESRSEPYSQTRPNNDSCNRAIKQSAIIPAVQSFVDDDKMKVCEDRVSERKKMSVSSEKDVNFVEKKPSKKKKKNLFSSCCVII